MPQPFDKPVVGALALLQSLNYAEHQVRRQPICLTRLGMEPMAF